MSETLIRIKEWNDPETSNDVLYSIPSEIAALVSEMNRCGKTEEAASLVRERGTPLVPLTIESVQY